jgi:4-carboxymuconolactone decarboxylase
MANEPRLPLVGDDSACRDLFDKASESFGYVPNLYRALAHHPAMLKAWTTFAWSLRRDASSPRSLRELAILRSSIITRAAYEWQAHVPMALAADITEEQILDLGTWRTSERFGAEERSVLAATDELTVDGTLTDATWSELRGRFDEAATLDIVLTVAFYSCVSRVVTALDVPIDAPHDGGTRPPYPFPSYSA